MRSAKKVEKAPHETLSDREFQVLTRLGGGKSIHEIAAELLLSPKTVSTYRSRLLDKLKLKDHRRYHPLCNRKSAQGFHLACVTYEERHRAFRASSLQGARGLLRRENTLQYQAHSAETQDLASPRQMGWSGCRDARSCVSTKAHPEKRIIAGDLASHSRYIVMRHLGVIMSLLQGLYNIRLIAQTQDLYISKMDAQRRKILRLYQGASRKKHHCRRSCVSFALHCNATFGSHYVAIAGSLQYQAHSAETQDLHLRGRWDGPCRDARSLRLYQGASEKRIIAGDLASHSLL